MNELNLILGTIAINRDKKPRKKYDDKCFKSQQAFYHHLSMSVMTPCTDHVLQLGVKSAITTGLSKLLYQNDSSKLFEVVAEINNIFPKKESIKDFKYILRKLKAFPGHVEICTQERLDELLDVKTPLPISEQIKKEPVKMIEQINDNTVIIKDRAILDQVRSSYHISDEKFWLLGAVVCIPVTTSIQLGILTQESASKILALNGDHNRIHLTHREICFGIGYEEGIKLMTSPLEFNIDKPITDFTNTIMDRAAASSYRLNLEDKTGVSISGLVNKKLVLESFITFVNQELSDDHDSDVNTGLEILQNHFTVGELFVGFTGYLMDTGRESLGLKNISGISLKELVDHIIIVNRKMQAVERELAGLNSGVIYINIDKEDLIPGICKACESWVMENKHQFCHQDPYQQHKPSPTQEALKTKRPDYTVGDNSQVISIKLVDNNGWGGVVEGIIKIFDERIKEQQVEVDKSFSVFLDQIRNGEISYEKVKEILTVPNIQTKNKYDTKYVIRALGGIPAAKEAIGLVLEDMDEKELTAILKYQIAWYQQAAGKMIIQEHDHVRSRVAGYLNDLWNEAVNNYIETQTPGIFRHYKNDDLEMTVLCKLELVNYEFPVWKTKVDIIKSKHFLSGVSIDFDSVEFSSNKRYNEDAMKKLLRT